MGIEVENAVVVLGPSKKEDVIKKNALTLEQGVTALTVWDDVSAVEATDLAKMISAQIKIVEEERKAMVSPLNAHVKYINSRFKTYSEPLGIMLVDVKAKILPYQQEQRDIAVKQAAIARKAEIEERLRIENEAREGQKDDVPVVHLSEPTPTQIAVVAGPTRGDFGTASLKKRWSWEVIDFEKVPNDYKCILSSAVTAEVREGVREIPGIRIFEIEEIAIR